MTKKKKGRVDATDNLRLSPQERLCPQYDDMSIKNYPIASTDKMGFRVKDNCAEENIQS